MTQPYETDFGLGPDDEDFRPEDEMDSLDIGDLAFELGARRSIKVS